MRFTEYQTTQFTLYTCEQIVSVQRSGYKLGQVESKTCFGVSFLYRKASAKLYSIKLM